MSEKATEITFEKIIEDITLLEINEKTFQKTYELFDLLRKKEFLNKDNLNNVFELVFLKIESQKMSFALKVYIDVQKASNDTSNMLLEYISDLCKVKMIEYGLEEEWISSSILRYFKADNKEQEMFDSLTTFFVAVKANTNIEKNSIQEKDAAIVFYLWYMIRCYSFRNYGYLEFSKDLEKTFCKYFSLIDEKSLEKTSRMSFSKSLLRGDLTSAFLVYCYLFHDSDRVIEELKTELKQKDKFIHQMKSRNDALEKLLSDSKREISEQCDNIKVLEDDKNRLSESVAEAEKRLDFEKNRFEMQYKTLAESLIEKTQKSFDLELQGIESIIEICFGLDIKK